MSSFFLSERSISRMAGVDPRLQKVALRAIQITYVDFGIPQYGGKRSTTDQQFLFSTGASKADGIENLSYHQSGKALDFYAYVDGAASWKESDLAAVACAFYQAAMELGVRIKWGGFFKNFKDMPHVQLIED